MVEDIDPHIIGITESWTNIDITDVELGLTGYVMFRKDRIGRRGGGVILYVKESIQAYEIKLEREADCDEAVWCKIVSGNSKLTIGLVYRSPNINKEDNTKIKNAIKEVSKGECIIMGDFNHGHIQWNSLESTGIEDQQFLFLIQDSFLTQHVLEPTRGENVLDIVLSSQKELVDIVKIVEPLGNSDHNQIHFDINVKSESKNKKTYKRNFHKGNYKDMRKYLAKLDWNNMLMNKTAIECWNILKYEIESIIDKFVPFQKQGKRCRKKHLSKEAIRKIMLMKFADDTKLFRKVNTDGYKQHLQNDLDRLVKWSEKWQMLFNFGKCKCLHTGHRNLNVNYKMGDTVLGTTVKEKDLGVTISADMKVSEQCGIAASKGNQILGLIRRNITYKGKKLIIPLYKAIVRPHLEYCIQAWRPYHKKDIDTLERIQRRATKTIPELRDLSYEERLKECGLTTLETRRLRGDQIEVFKILNGYENIDRNMFFSLKKDSRTRGHEVKLVKDQCRLDIRKHSFSQRTINE